MDSLLASAGVAGEAAAPAKPFVAPAGWLESVVTLPIEELHESPTNPRQHYDEADLAEFAEDIKAHGIMQPLRVRERVPELFKGDPNGRTGYELIYGHRRLKAARLAGLAKLPCIVTDWTDLQVKRAQISENLQRKDVHPFEEAEGFQALIREHGETADTIAASLGGPSKRSFVYGRLKMLQACAAVRKACIAGEIGSEIATMVARCGPEELQLRALKALKDNSVRADDGGKKSLQEARDLMARLFTLDIRSALFKVDDTTLVPGAVDCNACPKLSGNDPAFHDLTVKRKAAHGHWDVDGCKTLCTDIACWDRKKTAHLAKEAEALRAKGAVVVDGAKAKAVLKTTGYGKLEVKGSYVALSEFRAELKKRKSKTLAGKPIEEACVVLVQNPADGKLIEAIEKKTLRDVGIDPDKKPATVDHQAAVQKQQRKAQDLTARNRELLSRVRAAGAARQFDLADVQLVVESALRAVSRPSQEEMLAELWNRKSFDALLDDLPTLSWADLAALLLDVALTRGITVPYYALDSEPDFLYEVAERWGVPLEAPEPAPTPSPAALAPADSRADADAQALAEDMADADAAAAKAAPTPKPAARALAKAPPLKYRNPLTGETWSGRGLQPKWLKVAIAGGKTLADFELSQAASGRKDDKGAGSAGVSSPTTPAKAGGVTAKGKTEGGAA